MSDFVIEDGLEERPSYSLYSVHGVYVAALCGSLLAAGIVMGINYRRVGRTDAARIAVALGVFATVLLLVFIFSTAGTTSDRIPNIVFIAPQLVLVFVAAKSFQGNLIDAHTARGGAVASVWRAIGIGLLCLPAVAGIAFGTLYLLEPSYGEVAAFGKDEIYYSDEATADDARKLARVLKDEGMFGGDGVSVQISASHGTYSISFLVREEAWQDAETLDAFHDLGKTIATSGFPTPLTIYLCNDVFSDRRKTIVVVGATVAAVYVLPT